MKEKNTPLTVSQSSILSNQAELKADRLVFKDFLHSHFPSTVPNKAYKNQGQLQMFTKGKKAVLIGNFEQCRMTSNIFIYFWIKIKWW